MPPGPDHTDHLGDALGRFRNEEDHERHSGCQIDYREWKRHGVALLETPQLRDVPRTRESNLFGDGSIP